MSRPALALAPRPQLLMCPPRHFEVSYSINPWMQPERQRVDRTRAQRQWKALQRACARHADLHELAPAAGLPDLVFTANAGLVHGPCFVPAAFRHPQRQPESTLFADWFHRRGYRLRPLPPGIVFEGAGDALFEPGGRRLWMGQGPRSAAAAAPALRAMLGIEVEPLQLIDPRFYHLDTCFCPLPRGGLLYFPAAFDEDARLRIEAAFPADRRIAVTEAEALRFACNAIVLGEVVLADGLGAATTESLAELGFDVEPVALDEFHKSGGSAKCLSLRLDVPEGVALPQARVRPSQSSAPRAAARPLAKQAVSR